MDGLEEECMKAKRKGKKKRQQREDSFEAKAEQMYGGICFGDQDDVQECTALHKAVGNSSSAWKRNEFI